MSDQPPHLTVVEGTRDQESEDTASSPPTTAPIRNPRGYESWKRKSFTEGLIEAYHRLGGIEYLVTFGRNHPAEFIKACSRLIPREIQSSMVGEVTIVHTLRPTALDVHQETEASSKVNHIVDRTLLNARGEGDKE